ncbi:uncharacterized protein LOC122672333 [Telopea speciosissima]|uniref:uncharacterized protein LOC122672333 n=1 Tax=Telopea speciosissima TaxID=54955 RepID=UPI001CC5F0B4|nr:uncharacterized protein LOC122672333 [Telopea speciosissima]
MDDMILDDLFDSVDDDQTPWSNLNIIISDSETEVKELEERTNKSITRLSKDLFHSRKIENLKRKIAKIEAYLTGKNSRLKKREKPKERCMENNKAQNSREEVKLTKKELDDHISLGFWLGFAIGATTFGLLFGSLFSAASESKS